LFSAVLYSHKRKEKRRRVIPLETEEDWWDKDDWDDFEWEFDFFDSYKSPTVSVTYGFSSINLQNFSGSFADPNIPELKLGYTSERPTWETENILKYKYSYLFLSSVRTDIQGTPAVNEIESNLWRFGFGWASGYGYNLGSSAITPFNSIVLPGQIRCKKLSGIMNRIGIN
jgi:hypothetical protein